MKRFLTTTALSASLLLAGCGGSSNSSHSGSTTPPPPPPPTTTSFTSYVIGLLAQAANSVPAEVNDVSFSFPDQNNPTAFDSVVGSQ